MTVTGKCARCSIRYQATTSRQQLCPECKLRECERCGEKYEPTSQRQQVCKDCRKARKSERHREWYHEHIEERRAYARERQRIKRAQGIKPSYEATRNSVLKAKYGITLDDYRRIIEQQNNVCSICSCASDRTLHVDHDHNCCAGRKSCGQCIRGLICSSCNQGLGLFQDNPGVLRAAALYVENGGSTSDTK